jgi:hypothetical protein
MSGLPEHQPAEQATRGGTDPEHLICSAKGCQQPARWTLLWNNPKIHTPDREKSWLACDEHRDHLADFLGRRGFFRRYEAL